MWPKYSSAARDTSAEVPLCFGAQCWTPPVECRDCAGLRTLCGDPDACAIIELNILFQYFQRTPCAKTPICAKNPICAKTRIITVNLQQGDKHAIVRIRTNCQALFFLRLQYAWKSLPFHGVLGVFVVMAVGAVALILELVEDPNPIPRKHVGQIN